MKHTFSLLLALALLSACTIEGGVQPQATAVVLPTTPVPQPTAAPPQAWRIGLLDPPADLYPEAADETEARRRMPITQLIFPDPVLSHSFSYTVTNVLERLPTLQNGGAELRDAQVYLDAAGNITSTATQVITTRQQLVVTYTLQADQFWADGTPLTAEDSLFAYEVARAYPLGPEAQARLELTERYEVVDQRTVVVYLKPDYLDAAYVNTFWTPLPRHVFRDTPLAEVARSEFARRPLGYGPYTYDTAGNNEIWLKRNPYYRGPAPAEDRVVFVFAGDDGFEQLRAEVAAGRLDLAQIERLPDTPSQFLRQNLADGLLRAVYTPGPIWEHIDLNLDVPLLQDIRMRRALAYAINRQRMVDELFEGQVPPLSSWLLPEQWAAAPPEQLSIYAHNPDTARQLLAEIGFQDSDADGVLNDGQGQPLSFQLLTTENSPIRSRVATMIAEDLAAVGIQLEILTLPVSELYGSGGLLKQRQFELALFAWLAGPDPRGRELWSCEAVPSINNDYVGDNFAGWCFKPADQAIRTATTSLDPAERFEAYLVQQRLFTQEVPALPLFQRPLLTLMTPDLQGVAPDALAPITWNISTWRREGQ